MVIPIFIYDDHPARRDSLKALIEMMPEMECVGTAENCSNVVADMDIYRPEIVLMDINMPGTDGIQGLKLIKKHYPHIKVLMQTVFDESDKIFECIKHGAMGYILKKDNVQRIVDAIMEVHLGGAVMNPSIALKVLAFFKPNSPSPLSTRETEVLQLLAEGQSYKMVAGKLSLSFHTVNSHCKRIYDKLHVSSLGEAIAFYYKNMHN